MIAAEDSKLTNGGGKKAIRPPRGRGEGDGGSEGELKIGRADERKTDVSQLRDDREVSPATSAEEEEEEEEEQMDHLGLFLFLEATDRPELYFTHFPEK